MIRLRRPARFSKVLASRPRAQHLAALAVAIAVAVVAGTFLSAPAKAEDPFGITSFTAHTINDVGSDYTTAGGHPDRNIVRFDIPYRADETPVEYLKDAGVNLPNGFFGNPAALPWGSQVGLVHFNPNAGATIPLANIAPEYGYPAQFLFYFQGVPISLYATLHPRTEFYGLTVGAPNAPRFPGVHGFITELWGVPAQHGQGSTDAPFLSNPVDCSDVDPTWGLVLDSWEHAGAIDPLTGRPDLSDPSWLTASYPSPAGHRLRRPGPRRPVRARRPRHQTTAAGRRLHAGRPARRPRRRPRLPSVKRPDRPQHHLRSHGAPGPRAQGHHRQAARRPQHLAVLGRAAWRAARPRLRPRRRPGPLRHHQPGHLPRRLEDRHRRRRPRRCSPPTTPIDDSVIGPEPIPGDVYLLKPHPGDLPIGGGSQDGKFRLLIQLENARYGVNIKLPGIATADKQTGQLTATFTDNPQLPSSHLQVNLKEGPRAPLATPTTCGSFRTTSDLVPWSTPGTPDAHPTASFDGLERPERQRLLRSARQAAPSPRP